MSLLACILLIISALIFMIKFAAGPFSKSPWYEWHLRFMQLNTRLQSLLFLSALLMSVFSSLILTGLLVIN